MTLREAVEALLIEHARGIRAEISQNGIRLINAVIVLTKAFGQFHAKNMMLFCTVTLMLRKANLFMVMSFPMFLNEEIIRFQMVQAFVLLE